jgi:hypothetical protein
MRWELIWICVKNILSERKQGGTGRRSIFPVDLFYILYALCLLVFSPYLPGTPMGVSHAMHAPER